MVCRWGRVWVLSDVPSARAAPALAEESDASDASVSSHASSDDVSGSDSSDDEVLSVPASAEECVGRMGIISASSECADCFHVTLARFPCYALQRGSPTSQ